MNRFLRPLEMIAAGLKRVCLQDDILDTRLEEAANADPQRDSWMQAPSLDVDYVQRQKKRSRPT